MCPVLHEDNVGTINESNFDGAQEVVVSLLVNRGTNLFKQRVKSLYNTFENDRNTHTRFTFRRKPSGDATIMSEW